MTNKEPILYIDDKEEKQYKFFLTFKDQYEALVVDSAQKALEVLQTITVKVILISKHVHKPEEIESLKQIANKFTDIIFIFITEIDNIQSITEVKVYNNITKPWKENELQIILNNAIETYNLKKENKQLAQNLLKAELKAKESDLLKSSFLSNISHEIRTPLNAITGFVQLLSEDNISKQKRDYFIDIIQQSSADLLSVIKNILDISKIETRQIEIIKTEIYLPALIKELHYIFSNHDLRKSSPNINFRYEIPKGEHQRTIISDRVRISQILSNLIINALKYTEEGEIVFGYDILTTDESQKVQFFVCDTGIGIPKDKFDYIFEQFKKIETPKKKLFRGNGLGLTISKKLAELMKGDISLKSEQGKGSDFFLTLTIKHLNKVSAANPHEFIPEKKHNWKGKKILVVEDWVSNFELLKAVLDDTQVEITHAMNGEEAISICNLYQKIDLILMDIQLPKIDGIQATREILKTRPQIPIIAQTAYSLPEDEKKAREAGCVDYLTKPIPRSKLLLKIGAFLD